MTEILLKRELEPAAQQQRRVAVLHRLTLLWFVLAAAAVVIAVAELHLPVPPIAALLGLGALGAIGALAVPTAHHRIDYTKLARAIAVQHPDLHALLVTAVEQQPDPETGRLSYLQQRLLDEALREVRLRENIEAVASRTLLKNQLLHAATAIMFIAALVGLPRDATPRASGLLAKASVTVTPGNATIERGSGLVVLAAFTRTVPGEATLVINTNGGERRVPLTRNLNDPVFGGSIPEVHDALHYHVECPGGRSPEYAVTVFEYPRLERADAAVTFPDYTGQPRKTIPDTRRISAVEGSTLDLSLALNKPVQSASLIGKDKSILPLTTETNAARATLPAYRLSSSGAYQLQLVDADGRTNKIPVQFAFDVLTNQRPQLKIAFPRGDQRVSALQEMLFVAEAQDDFGLRDWGLSYSVGGADIKSIALGGTAPARVKTNFMHLLRLEDLQAQPDQLISYFIWADDFGPDGALRRTSSDLFFSEVRPFEEIYREADGNDSQAQQQQQQQQQGQGQDPATKLAELQKQIINATWKLQRQESASKPSPRYTKDEGVIRESQENAFEQASALDEQLQEIRAKEFAQKAADHMKTALDHLSAATNTPALLPKALAAEQAAYQALLKLQSRQHQVMQARNQSRSSSSQNQNRQAQLNQLDLKKQQNRYETQREAEQQKPEQKKEQLEMLSRLKELAQRQQDINERLKELQTELQAAKTDREREELQRELKRLRDEQRDMLADMDEVRQQMEKPENANAQQQSRESMEQARQDAQRASEALEKNNVAQALSSGTRAERQLAQTRDEMRKSSSGQFNDDMRTMRNQARDLAEKEQQIQNEMQQANERPKTLSDDGKSEQISKQLAEQRQAVTNLLNEMKRVTEQAETAEPLLSKELYDSLRRNSQGNLDQSLTAAEELTKRNFLREAQPFEQRAAKDIDALKRDVEKAAESVLGDEAEALRMARRELDTLAEQLQRELTRAGQTNGLGSNGLAGAFGPGTNRAAFRSPGTNGFARANGERGSNNLQLAQSGRGTNGTTASSSSSTNSGPGSVNSTNALSRNSPSEQGRDARSSRNAPGQGNSGSGEAQNQQDIASANQGERQSQSPQRQGTQGQQGGPNGSQQSQGQSAPTGENPQQLAEQQQQNSPGGGQRPGTRGDRLASALNNQGEPTSSRQNTGANGGDDNGGGPLTGENFSEWSQRLSSVEEMLDRPALRNQLAQARDRARAARADFKRHSKKPQWDLVTKDILKPLVEVRDRVADELSHRDSNDSLAPIDRDPVPGKYGELVRRYYENLGK